MQIQIAKPFGREHHGAMELRQKVLGTVINLKKERKVMTFVAIEEGEIVGTASVERYPFKTARIRQVAVDPSQQGKGTGRKMIQAIEDHMMAQGFKRVILTSRVSAKMFYAKMGYTSHFFTFKDKNENRVVDLVWMKKRLVNDALEANVYQLPELD